MTAAPLLPLYTAAERSRELCHRSSALRHQAQRACAQSKSLRPMFVHLCTGPRSHVFVSARERLALPPLNVYNALLSLGV
jgi:hypothetical protein